MKSDDTLYQKNVALFEKFGSRYLSKINDADHEYYRFSKTEKGELNLFNQLEGYHYHSNRGALNEAIHSFQEIENITETQVLFVFGIGLGYFYDAAQKWLRGQKNRYLIFIEDNFSVIHKFLETEKATKILSNPQVILFPIQIKDEDHWDELPFEFRTIGKMFSFIPSQSAQLRIYKKQREKISNLIRLKIHLVLDEEKSRFKLKDEFSQNLAFNNLYSTLCYLPGSYLGRNLKGKFKGIPAVICGAGPSIKKIIKTIDTIKDQSLLFGAGTGMNVLNANGINPHFGGALDPYDVSLSRMMTNTAFEVPYCYTHRFHHEAFTYIHGSQILFRTAPFFGIETWFNELLGIDDNIEVPAKISTTNYCLHLAREMGCNPIILAGVDMAYTDSKRYPDKIKGHPLDQSQINTGIENLPYETGNLIPIKNEEGKNILTRWDWLSESNSYKEFHFTYPDVNLINVSQGGLLIEEISNSTIDAVKDKYLDEKYDLLNHVHATIHESESVNVSYKQVKSAFLKWKETLEASGEYLEQIIDYLDQTKSSVLQSGEIPETVFTEELESLFLVLKEQQSYTSYLSYMDEMFHSITLLEMHQLRMFPESYSEKRKFLKELEYEESKAKFMLSGVELHIGLVEKALKIKVFETSVPLKIKEAFLSEVYQECNGELIIKDPEMNLNVEVKVDTLNKPSRFYSKTGILLAEGWFLNGKREGKNWQYYHSGALYSIQRFKGGSLEGKQEYFYEDGNKKTILHYKNGLLNGKVELFYPNGKIHRELSFKEHEMNGYERIWNTDEGLVSEAQYEMGKPKGKSRKWYSNRQLAKEVIYYDKPENFDLTEWSPEGVLLDKQTYLPEILGEQVLQDSTERQASLEKIQEKLRDQLDES